MPTFTASTPASMSASVASAVATLPATRSVFGNSRRTRATMSMTPCEWPCAVSTTSTSTPARDERLRALERILGDADRRAAAQPAERVLARVRILDRLLDVLDGDEPLQPEVLVDDEQLLDLVPVQDLARLVERRADRHGEERVLRHHLADRPLDVGLEAQVAVGQDADQPPFLAAVLGDRHARDPVALHQVERFVDPVGGGERDRVDDHAALRPLHAIDLGRLLLDRQVLVDDARGRPAAPWRWPAPTR